MTVKGRFSLDTNILIYAVDRDAGERHKRSKEIVARAALHDCVLTVQALAEFFHATTRKNLLALSHAGTFVRDWIDVFRVVSATDTAFINAIEGVEEHRLAFWDALLWATARQSGCSAIISEDMQDGRRLGGVEIINPFTDDSEARLASLLDS